MMREQWIVITLGVLSKRYGISKVDSLSAFRTTFSGCFFAISNKESAPAYKFVFESACKVVQQLCDIKLAEVVRQYHADWHAGEEVARREVFTNSLRCGDWAHFVGACSVRTKTPVPVKGASNHDKQVAVAWRVGVYATIRGCFEDPADKEEAVEFFKPVFEQTRCVPTLLLFHTTWHSAFEHFASKGLNAQSCVDKLIKLYFIKKELTAEDTLSWAIETWRGDTTWVYYAAWWSGCQRIQPGSASGTQAQEAWHKSPFKSFMKDLHVSVPEFVEKLCTFCEVRLEQMVKEGEPLIDIPCEPWPNRCLMDDPKLFQQRRTSALEFLAHGQLSKFNDTDGTSYYAMRQHLFTWSVEQRRWEKEENPSAPDPDLSQHLMGLYKSRTTEDLDMVLSCLHIALPDGIEDLVRLFSKYVLVVVGPAAAEHWHAQAPPGSGFLPHALALCAFCWEAAIHSTCEHAYAAFLDPSNCHEGLPLNTSVSDHPVKRTQRHVAPQRMLWDKRSVLLPRMPRKDQTQGEGAVSQCDPLVQQVLRALELGNLGKQLAENHLTLAEFQHWDFRVL